MTLPINYSRGPSLPELGISVEDASEQKGFWGGIFGKDNSDLPGVVVTKIGRGLLQGEIEIGSRITSVTTPIGMMNCDNSDHLREILGTPGLFDPKLGIYLIVMKNVSLCFLQPKRLEEHYVSIPARKWVAAVAREDARLAKLSSPEFLASERLTSLMMQQVQLWDKEPAFTKLEKIPSPCSSLALGPETQMKKGKQATYFTFSDQHQRLSEKDALKMGILYSRESCLN